MENNQQQFKRWWPNMKQKNRDTIGVLRHDKFKTELKQTESNYKLQYSCNILKENITGKQQKRKFLVTKNYVYNIVEDFDSWDTKFSTSYIKRQIKLKNITKISWSVSKQKTKDVKLQQNYKNLQNQFILHVPAEYDLMGAGLNKNDTNNIILSIVKNRDQKTEMYFINKPNLSLFTTFKNEVKQEKHMIKDTGSNKKGGNKMKFKKDVTSEVLNYEELHKKLLNKLQPKPQPKPPKPHINKPHICNNPVSHQFLEIDVVDVLDVPQVSGLEEQKVPYEEEKKDSSSEPEEISDKMDDYDEKVLVQPITEQDYYQSYSQNPKDRKKLKHKNQKEGKEVYITTNLKAKDDEKGKKLKLNLYGVGQSPQLVRKNKEYTSYLRALRSLQPVNLLSSFFTFKNMNVQTLQTYVEWENQKELCLITEYSEEGSLYNERKKIASKNAKEKEEFAKQIAVKMALGINYLHNKEIIVSDLTPKNVVLCDKPEMIRIKDSFSDKFLKKKDNVIVIATPEFMAPEVIFKKFRKDENSPRISKEMNWYNYGVILYYMLIGQTPFTYDNSKNITIENQPFWWHLCSTKINKDWFLKNRIDTDQISSDGQDFLEKLLVKMQARRLTFEQIKNHKWLSEEVYQEQFYQKQ